MENQENQPTFSNKPHTAYALFFLRVTVGFIFLISGVGKLLDISSFADNVTKFNILPQFFIIPFSIIIPFSEVFLGGAFILGLFVKIAGIGLSTLLFSFLFAIGKKILDGTPADCGCGGVIASTNVGNLLFLKDVVLLLGVIIILRFSFYKLPEATTVQLPMNIFETILIYFLCAIAVYSFFYVDILATTR